MIINRVWAMPSAWTFTIKPIKELLNRYVGDGKGWADPFAGMNSPAEFTNDINPERRATYHLDAEDFCKELKGKILTGVLFDPPYSNRQISEHYKSVGRKVSAMDTSCNFYTRVLDPLSELIKPGGIAVSFGWNSAGFGKNRSFEIVEILLVPHGGHKNDTIVTVERKLSSRPILGVR